MKNCQLTDGDSDTLLKQLKYLVRCNKITAPNGNNLFPMNNTIVLSCRRCTSPRRRLHIILTTTAPATVRGSVRNVINLPHCYMNFTAARNEIKKKNLLPFIIIFLLSSSSSSTLNHVAQATVVGTTAGSRVGARRTVSLSDKEFYCCC